MEAVNLSTVLNLNESVKEPVSLRWTLRLMYIAVFAVGIVGNSVVCAAVIKRKRLRSSYNLFTFNLACADLMVVMIYVPTQMAAFENNHNWALGNAVCRIAYAVIPLALSASIGSLLAITVNRYRAVVFPIRPKLTRRNIQVTIAAIWVFSLVTALPVIFVAGTEVHQNGQFYCSEPGWPPIAGQLYWILIFVIQYVMPLIVITILSGIAARKLTSKKKSLFNKKRSSLVMTPAVQRRMQQGTRISQMLFVLIGIYAICMLPQHAVFFWMEYGNLNRLHFKMYIFRLSNVFPMINCALNPIAYGTLNKEFAAVFKVVLGRKGRRNLLCCQRRNNLTAHIIKDERCSCVCKRNNKEPSLDEGTRVSGISESSLPFKVSVISFWS